MLRETAFAGHAIYLGFSIVWALMAPLGAPVSVPVGAPVGAPSGLFATMADRDYGGRLTGARADSFGNQGTPRI